MDKYYTLLDIENQLKNIFVEEHLFAVTPKQGIKITLVKINGLINMIDCAHTLIFKHFESMEDVIDTIITYPYNLKLLYFVFGKSNPSAASAIKYINTKTNKIEGISIYIDTDIKNFLSKEEYLYVAFHEMGHIFCQFDNDITQTKNNYLESEIEADNFALSGEDTYCSIETHRKILIHCNKLKSFLRGVDYDMDRFEREANELLYHDPDSVARLMNIEEKMSRRK